MRNFNPLMPVTRLLGQKYMKIIKMSCLFHTPLKGKLIQNGIIALLDEEILRCLVLIQQP